MGELELSGTVAIVTGGAKGVGRLLTEVLTSAGAAVAIVGRNRDALHATAESLRREGATVLPIVADVKDRRATADAIATTRGELGPIDTLINNAGVVNLGTVESTDLDFWWEAFEINVRAPMLWCQSVLPEMIERGHGRIVNLTSTAVAWTVTGASAYSASKAAVSKFTNVLDAEVRPEGVHVFAYSPRLKTDMTDHIQSSPIMSEAFRAAASSATQQDLDARRQRSIDLFVRIMSGQLDHLAGQHLETEVPPPPAAA